MPIRLLLLLIASPLAAQPPEQGPPPRHVDRYGDPLPAGAIQRFGSLRLRHPQMNDFTVLADGKTAVSVGRDGQAHWWNLDTGRQIHVKAMSEGILSANGRVMAQSRLSEEKDRMSEVILIELETGRVFGQFTTPESISVSLAVSADGSRAAAGTDKGRVTLHDGRTKATVAFDVGDDEANPRLSFSPDGKRLMVGMGRAGRLSVRDAGTGKELWSRKADVDDTALASSDEWVAILESAPPGDDEAPGRLSVVEFKTGKQLAPTLAIPDWHGGGLAVSPDGKTLLLTNYGSSRLIDAKTGRVVRRLCGGERAQFTPDGSRVVIRRESGLRCLETATGRAVADPGSECDFQRVRFSPDGRKMAVGDFRNDRMEVWDTKTARPTATLDDHPGHFLDCMFINGGRVLRGCNEFESTTWNLAAGSAVHTRLQDASHAGERRQAWGAGFREHLLIGPDGARAANIFIDRSTPEYSVRLTIHNAGTGRLIYRGLVDATDIRFCHGAVCLPGSETLLLHEQHEFTAVDARLGKTLASIRGNFSCMSADGRWVVSNRDKLWETATWHETDPAPFRRELERFRDREKWVLVAVHGRTLVVTDDKALRVIDLASGKERGRWPLPDLGLGAESKHPVERLRLVPDGRTVFTSLRDGTALTWDLSVFPTPRLSETHTETDMAGWWADLAGADTEKAYSAIWRLAETPSETLMSFLRERLRPVTAPSEMEWKALMTSLENREFRVRAAALRRVEQFGHGAWDELQREIWQSSSAETRERLGQLAAKMSGPRPSPETLRFLRVLAVLEEVKTPAARRLVEELTHGVATARETKAAVATLARMPDQESWRR